MNKPEVRIVTLEPMRVISFHGFGKEPEMQAIGKLVEWMRGKGLDGARRFGFNNPDPAPGSPNYGYEMWLAVGSDVPADGEARAVDFAGGLYAVTQCEARNPGKDIPATWKALVKWREDSGYKAAQHQWLEEHLTPLATLLAGAQSFVLDLYMPIRE